MFLTGMFPFATLALPALAGGMLVAVVIEMGAKTAVTVYVSVSLLSVLVVADKEAALMFLFFFGFYPIAKERLERLRPRALEIAVKFAIFNGTVAAAFLCVIYLLGVSELLEEFGDYGKYGAWFMLALGNVTFLLYDIALTKYISLYIYKLRQRFLRK
jgi:hypothetical protein